MQARQGSQCKESVNNVLIRISHMHPVRFWYTMLLLVLRPQVRPKFTKGPGSTARGARRDAFQSIASCQDSCGGPPLRQGLTTLPDSSLVCVTQTPEVVGRNQLRRLCRTGECCGGRGNKSTDDGAQSRAGKTRPGDQFSPCDERR